MQYKKIFVSLFIMLFLFCACVDPHTDDVHAALDDAIRQVNLPEVIETDSLYLPAEIGVVQISWTTDHPEYIALNGKVTRPEPETGSLTVTLSAAFSLAGVVRTVQYPLTVSAKTAEEILAAALAELDIGPVTAVTADLTLPASLGKVAISWTSANPEYLEDSGTVKRPLFGQENVSVSLTATLSYLEKTETKHFLVTIIAHTMRPADYSQVLGFAGGINPINLKVGDPGYYQVSNEREFLEVLTYENNTKKGTVAAKVIEITKDLNLGYREVLAKYPGVTFNDTIFREHKTPQTHPTLMETGVSKITIQDRNSSKAKYGAGLIIFSKTGAAIRHAAIQIKRSESVVIRNLTFEELWEYDDSGKYDRNDWDYLTLEDVDGVWIDHITMGRAYDGLIDMKGESKNVSITWSRFEAVRTSFIDTQVTYLEQHKSQFPKYKNLRDQGLSLDIIADYLSLQKKGHLVGANELKEENNTLTITIAYNIYTNLQDRLPRLRGGDAHVYNVILDASLVYQLKTQYPALNIVNQGLVTTENGAVLMEDSIYIDVSTPIKNNQVDDENALYTGKYRVVHSLYRLGDEEEISSSETEDSIWIPSNGAPVIAFSFNNFSALPYTYEKVDVAELEAFLEASIVGATSADIDWLDFH